MMYLMAKFLHVFPPENGTNVTVWGTGKPRRQFIYSLWERKKRCPYEKPLNASQKPWTSRDNFWYPLSVISPGVGAHQNLRSDGQFKKTASNAKLRKYLPDFQFTPFDQAVKEMCDWFSANYDRARK
ncbi:putative GDP-L-fucose synthase protein [Naja naja]|nr:putative GDP-L-fucose synthase protein [Naja naja]